jgi:hypothetical protein
MSHGNGSDSGVAKIDPGVPASKGLTPLAKILMFLALGLVFMQGTFTVIAANYGRLPPASAVKVPLPPQAP